MLQPDGMNSVPWFYNDCIDYNDDVYHLGCPSYPNCDIDPSGCIRESGINDVEWYGHRD